MSPSRKTVLTALIAALAGATTIIGPASAATWPASVGGTWAANGAGYSPHTIKLTQKNDNAKCKQIKGTLDFEGQPTQLVAGFYCPQSGRIIFTRVYQGETIQIWSGQLSQPASGEDSAIAGGIAAVTDVGGIPGENPFYAVRID